MYAIHPHSCTIYEAWECCDGGSHAGGDGVFTLPPLLHPRSPYPTRTRPPSRRREAATGVCDRPPSPPTPDPFRQSLYTRNPTSETRNPKPGTRNPEPGWGEGMNRKIALGPKRRFYPQKLTDLYHQTGKSTSGLLILSRALPEWI